MLFLLDLSKVVRELFFLCKDISELFISLFGGRYSLSDVSLSVHFIVVVQPLDFSFPEKSVCLFGEFSHTLLGGERLELFFVVGDYVLRGLHPLLQELYGGLHAFDLLGWVNLEYLTAASAL